LREFDRVDIRRDLLEKFACSLSLEDIVVVEATGNASAVSAVIAPHVKRVAIANPKQVKIIAYTHALSLVTLSSGSLRATRRLLIRAHAPSGKVARSGHVTSSGSKPTVDRRGPARTFVLPVPLCP
jgi:hypothetical protein